MIRLLRTSLRAGALLSLLTVGVAAAPIITATKDDNLAAGLRKVVGNTITYTIVSANTGTTDATSVLFTDPDPANTTFVSVNSTPIARDDPAVFSTPGKPTSTP